MFDAGRGDCGFVMSIIWITSSFTAGNNAYVESSTLMAVTSLRVIVGAIVSTNTF